MYMQNLIYYAQSKLFPLWLLSGFLTIESFYTSLLAWFVPKECYFYIVLAIHNLIVISIHHLLPFASVRVSLVPTQLLFISLLSYFIATIFWTILWISTQLCCKYPFIFFHDSMSIPVYDWLIVVWLLYVIIDSAKEKEKEKEKETKK